MLNIVPVIPCLSDLYLSEVFYTVQSRILINLSRFSKMNWVGC